VQIEHLLSQSRRGEYSSGVSRKAEDVRSNLFGEPVSVPGQHIRIVQKRKRGDGDGVVGLHEQTNSIALERRVGIEKNPRVPCKKKEGGDRRGVGLGFGEGKN